MNTLKVTLDPKEVGMSAERLALIDTYFKDYVDDGRLPGYHVAVARYGQIVYSSTYGMRDVEAKLPIEQDTVYRIFSMTKPITSIAIMMLIEDGKLQLTDAVSKFIPSFADTKVFVSGTAENPVTVPMKAPMQVWHLMSHTSGLTYGWNFWDEVDASYRIAEAKFLVENPNPTLEQVCDRYASLPLEFEPGTSWNYSVSTDVLGRVVEVASGMNLEDFFQTRILKPLGMHDTGFFAPAEKHSRLAALYSFSDTEAKKTRREEMGNRWLSRPSMLSGGGGLVSTAYDYWQFMQMLENGGVLNGVRLLSPNSIDQMTLNHLPNNQDITSFGMTLGWDQWYSGLGFGLGFAVVTDQAKAKTPCPTGTFSWGGMASTAFWIDPVEEISVMFFTQLMPSTSYEIRPYLRTLVYGAITE